MTRLAASLVLVGALVSTADRTKAEDTIPPAAFPTIPAQAQSASDLVPSGWIVEKEARSDLNGDGVPDLMLLLHMTEPKNVVAGGGLGTDQLDTNPRLLVVAFANKASDGFALALANHTLIPRHTDPRMEDPLSDVSVVRGTLRVSLGSWMSAGGWSMSHSKFTFRHQDGCFKLIGHDTTDVQRNTGKMSELSVNYLTKKVKRSWGYSDDAMNESWKTIQAADLLCLEAVGDGLEFAPGLEPDANRAAELLKATAEAEPLWSTSVASLRLGSDDQSATFKDLRSTCSEAQLTLALEGTAAELHDCLDQTMTVRVTVVFAAGQLASKVEPDDEGTACVAFALDRAHFDDLACTFEASVSSP